MRLPIPPRQAYLAELPSLVAEITAGTIAVEATMMPLAGVQQIWSRAELPGAPTWPNLSAVTCLAVGFTRLP